MCYFEAGKRVFSFFFLLSVAFIPTPKFPEIPKPACFRATFCCHQKVSNRKRHGQHTKGHRFQLCDKEPR